MKISTEKCSTQLPENDYENLSHSLSEWETAFAKLKGAYSDNTLRAYRSDFQIFAEWCRIREREPLPARSADIAEFLNDEAGVSSTSTIKRRLVSIKKIHRVLNMKEETESEDVTLALRRILRSKSKRQKQAVGLTAKIRDKILSSCQNDLVGTRDRALIMVGYDTLCRRSELAALQIEDLQSTPRGGMQILIRRSKNDQYGEGRTGYISSKSAAAVQDWLNVAELSAGPIFRRIIKAYVGTNALHPHTVGQILKQRARLAGLDEHVVDGISGHSMRVGAAQDMMLCGADLLPIMRSGGWKSTTVVARYVENASLDEMARWRK